MTRYEVIYSEIKHKNFNSRERMKKFLYGKKSNVYHIVAIHENRLGTKYAVNVMNFWDKS